MRELEDRFRSLDRVEAPDLWNEAVTRAAELGGTRRRPVSRAFVLVAAALLLALLAGAIVVGARLIRPAPDLSSLRYANGLIVSSGACGQVIAVDPNSSQTRELAPGSPGCTEGEYLPVETAWSSDGRLLAYGVWRSCGGCLDQSEPAGAWVYDVASGASLRIGECPEHACKEIDISADGSLVTYYAESQRNGQDTLVVVEVDSGRSHQIALPGEADSPSFSPDGSRILLPMLGGTSGLYVVDTSRVASDAAEPTFIYGMVEAINAVWSPDGEWIAFDQASADGYGIWVVRADGSEPKMLSIGPALEAPGHPTWSPDSRSIAYVRTPGESDGATTLELSTVGLDGDESSRIYASGCCIFDWSAPAWSPDGEYISFGVGVADRPAVSGTAYIRPDGTDLHWVTADFLRPDWQPVPIPSAAE